MREILEYFGVPQLLYTITLTISGLIVSGFLENFFDNWICLFFKILAATSLWEFTHIINDIFDEKIDKILGKKTLITSSLISKKTYFKVAILFLTISILPSLILKRIIFPLLVIFTILLNFIYSVPPLRLKRSGLKSCFIGLGSIIVFLFGYFWPSTHFTLQIYPPLTHEIILLLILLFFSASVGTVISDLKDFKGDKKHGIKTIFTVFGLELGKKISLILLFISFLMPIILFHTVVEIIAFIFIATISTFLFKETESANLIILLSILVIIYCTLRFAGTFYISF